MAPETPPPTSEHRGLRRLGGGLLTLLVALGGVVLLLLFFQSRDDSQLDRPASPESPATAGPGERFTGSGLPPVVPSAPAGGLSDAEVLDLTARGNVVLLHGAATAAGPLQALARRVAGPSDPALEEVGQGIVLDRRPALDGVVALAWKRVLRTGDARDPRIEDFASHWLGQGAP
jgi:hypothetical protein